MQPMAVLLLCKPVVVMLVWAIIWGMSNKLRWATYFPAIAGLAYLMLGAWFWDMRHPSDFYATPSRLEAIEPVRELISPQATVYWEGSVQEAWFWLQRANYVSSSQAAGNVFSRGNALETGRRITRLKALGFQDNSLDWKRMDAPDKRNETSAAQLHGICGDASLDFAILRHPANEPALLEINDSGMGHRYSIYNCGYLRTSLKMTGLGVDKNE
jgi:hypothetical protein